MFQRERGRVRNTFNAFKGFEGTQSFPVSLLTTVFKCAASLTRKVDLFIVDRRLAFTFGRTRYGPSCDQQGFLLGLRLADGDIEAPASQLDCTTDVGRLDVLRARTAAEVSDASASMPDTDSVSTSSAHSSSVRRGILKKSRFGSVPRRLGPPLGEPWVRSDVYLDECSLSMLEDLVATWNFSYEGCCAWHAAINHLQDLVSKLPRFYDCSHGWKPSGVRWQIPAT